MLRLSIRPMLASDWPAVEAIYREGIEGGNATFEAEPPTWREFDHSRRRDARLVAVDDRDAVVGWAAGSAVSNRAAYRGVVEHSVYVATESQGRGVGRALLRALLDLLEGAGCWTVQASIFAENTTSLALHKQEGFRVVGRREAIALMTVGPRAGQWRDTLLVERRSDRNGRLVRGRTSTGLMDPGTMSVMAEKKTRTEETDGFTAEERAAMKERAAELRAQKGRTKGASKAAADLQDVLDAIAKLPDDADRALTERLHVIITEAAPQLAPKTWYGMPAYALDGKVLLFLQPASKFETRYLTLGFNDTAQLDDGAMWPASFAVTKVGAAETKVITELVHRAIG